MTLETRQASVTGIGRECIVITTNHRANPIIGSCGISTLSAVLESDLSKRPVRDTNVDYRVVSFYEINSILVGAKFGKGIASAGSLGEGGGELVLWH